MKWYASISDIGNENLIPPASFPLESNATYYVTQTIDKCESLPHAILTSIITTVEDEEKWIDLHPNPVRDLLNIKFTSVIEEITIINSIGKKVQETQSNTASTVVDVSGLVPGF